MDDMQLIEILIGMALEWGPGGLSLIAAFATGYLVGKRRKLTGTLASLNAEVKHASILNEMAMNVAKTQQGIALKEGARVVELTDQLVAVDIGRTTGDMKPALGILGSIHAARTAAAAEMHNDGGLSPEIPRPSSEAFTMDGGIGDTQPDSAESAEEE